MLSRSERAVCCLNIDLSDSFDIWWYIEFAASACDDIFDSHVFSDFNQGKSILFVDLEHRLKVY